MAERDTDLKSLWTACPTMKCSTNTMNSRDGHDVSEANSSSVFSWRLHANASGQFSQGRSFHGSVVVFAHTRMSSGDGCQGSSMLCCRSLKPSSCQSKCSNPKIGYCFRTRCPIAEVRWKVIAPALIQLDLGIGVDCHLV